MTAPEGCNPGHALDVLKRWEAGPIATDAEVRYLVGVLRLAVIILATPEPDTPLAGDEAATAAWQKWHDKRMAALWLAGEITDEEEPSG